jgi:hypothetical protein
MKITLRRYEPGIDMYRLYDGVHIGTERHDIDNDNMIPLQSHTGDGWTVLEIGDHLCIVHVTTELHDGGCYVARGAVHEIAALLEERYR